MLNEADSDLIINYELKNYQGSSCRRAVLIIQH